MSCSTQAAARVGHQSQAVSSLTASAVHRRSGQHESGFRPGSARVSRPSQAGHARTDILKKLGYQLPGASHALSKVCLRSREHALKRQLNEENLHFWLLAYKATDTARPILEAPPARRARKNSQPRNWPKLPGNLPQVQVSAGRPGLSSGMCLRLTSLLPAL